MKKPQVTLGLCVRNSENTINEAISGIIDQDFPRELMEVIFVDDGSEDKTLSIIRDSVSKIDRHVKVFHTKWRGLGPARNTVVDNAQGDYIIWIDSDTVLPKDYVRKLVEFMEQNPAVGVAKGKIGFVPVASLVATLENMAYYTAGSKNEGRPSSKPFGTCGSIFRIDAIKQVGGFDVRIKGAGEDMDALDRIREAGLLLYVIDAVFYDKFKETWKALWRAYYWHGYGMHQVMQKNKNIERLYEMSPPAGFIEGLLYSFDAFRLTGRKAAFLLPLFFVFKATAWCLGYAKGHMSSHRRTTKM